MRSHPDDATDSVGWRFACQMIEMPMRKPGFAALFAVLLAIGGCHSDDHLELGALLTSTPWLLDKYKFPKVRGNNEFEEYHYKQIYIFHVDGSYERKIPVESGVVGKIDTLQDSGQYIFDKASRILEIPGVGDPKEPLGQGGILFEKRWKIVKADRSYIIYHDADYRGGDVAYSVILQDDDLWSESEATFFTINPLTVKVDSLVPANPVMRLRHRD